jgi:hypothetical protein
VEKFLKSNVLITFQPIFSFGLKKSTVAAPHADHFMCDKNTYGIQANTGLTEKFG